MKHPIPKYLFVAAAFGCVVFDAQAGALQSKQVPAEAQWFLHLDFDGFKATKLGKLALDPTASYAKQLDAMAALLQFDLRKDLNSVTFYGQVNPTGEPERAVALVRGQFKPDHLLNLLKLNPTFKSEKAGTHELLAWTDKKEGVAKENFASIASDKLLVWGSQRPLLLQALKVIGGQGETLNPNRLENLKMDKGAFFIAVVVSLEGLPIPPQAKFLEQVKSLGLTFREEGANLEASVRLQAANATASMQLRDILQGLIAIGQLAVAGNADPKVVPLAELLKQVTLEQSENLVQVRLTVPLDQVLQKARAQLGIELGKPKSSTDNESKKDK